ncbi:MAG: GIY-YIG nuclease family protein [Gemmatimonadota bacterium]|nr:GIY-YIG nuclease family protein [Gemmatimonadota bacterium]
MVDAEQEARAKSGFIRCYGLFWDRHAVAWNPGKGGGAFRLLGRDGKYRPGLRVCDFRDQLGIYVLYDDYGAHYVGLTRKQPLGNRLRQHLTDRHGDSWDRFSWFGFRRVLKHVNGAGVNSLGASPKQLLTDTADTIGDIEALLIQALGTQRRGNWQEMTFAAARHWDQLTPSDSDIYLGRVAPQ